MHKDEENNKYKVRVKESLVHPMEKERNRLDLVEIIASLLYIIWRISDNPLFLYFAFGISVASLIPASIFIYRNIQLIKQGKAKRRTLLAWLLPYLIAACCAVALFV